MSEHPLYANTLICSMKYVSYLRQDGDSEGLVVVLTHQVEGDDWEDVPRCGASLPTYQLLPQPEPRGKLLRLKKKQGQENVHAFISHTSLLQIRESLESLELALHCEGILSVCEYTVAAPELAVTALKSTISDS